MIQHRLPYALLALLFPLAAQATCPDGKTYPVALTFDDGPAVGTPKVLDVLKAHHVKATFFVLGEHFASPAGAEQAKKLVARERDEGHWVGTHTYHHLKHTSLSPEAMHKNISTIPPELEPYLNKILRLPYGDGYFKTSSAEHNKRDVAVMNEIKQNGFTHVAWDIDTNDWDKAKQSGVKQSMLHQICAEKGGVILMHDIQANTVEHLAEWIEAIQAQGHPIVGLEHFVPEAAQPWKCKPKSNQHSCGIDSKPIPQVDEFENLIQHLSGNGGGQ